MWKTLSVTLVVALIIAGAIALLLTTGPGNAQQSQQEAIRKVVIAEVTAIREKAQRYLDIESTVDELQASTPMLTSIVKDLGLLSSDEITAFRRTVTLDMEMRKSGDRKKTIAVIGACDQALTLLKADQLKSSQVAMWSLNEQLSGVITGGILGIMGTLSTTIVVVVASNRRRAKAICPIVRAEVTAIKEKAERYVAGTSSKDELCASTPMLTSIASEIGFLSEQQAVDFRRAVTLDMEMRKVASKDKTLAAIDACEICLESLNR